MSFTIFIINRANTRHEKTMKALRDAGFEVICFFKNIYEAQAEIEAHEGCRFIILQELNASDPYSQEFDFFKQVSRNHGSIHVFTIVASEIPDITLAEDFLNCGAEEFIVIPESINTYSQILKASIEAIVSRQTVEIDNHPPVSGYINT